ncbi:MAG: hypothetical protein HOV97_09935 [Nonomuraea sp.]|nr:hypothetical protein [Nonomuraea sp.]
MVAGLLLPPLIAAGLMYGVGEITRTMAVAFSVSWPGLGVVAAAGAGLAFLAGSRLSPLASLLGGLAFTALGAVPVIELRGTRVIPDGLLPGSLASGLQTVTYSGVMLFVGVALLVVSAFPSRWRSLERPSAYTSDYGASGSPYLPEDVTRPMYRE